MVLKKCPQLPNKVSSSLLSVKYLIITLLTLSLPTPPYLLTHPNYKNFMSTTKKQTEANRQNALKSTGPKTEQGKSISSQNAVKHGLYARDVIINSPHLRENRVDYELLYESLCDELQPESMFQTFLVRKIANCLWRSRRAVSAETAHINRRLDNVNREYNHDFMGKYYYEEDIDELDTEDFTEFDQQDLDNIIGTMSLPDDNDSKKSSAMKCASTGN